MNITKRIYQFALVGLCLLICLMYGCAGGNGSSSGLTGPGRMVVTVDWGSGSRSAAHSRFIPPEANVIVLTLQTQQAAGVVSRIIERPTTGTISTLALENLPLLTLNVVVKSYATTPTGTPLSQGTYTQVITTNTTANLALGTSAAVAQLTADLTAKSLAVNDTLTVQPQAYDASHNALNISFSSLTWVSSDPTIVSAAVTGTGATLTAHKAGTVTVTVTDSETHTSFHFTMTVMTLTLPTTPVSLYTSGTHTFAATVTGPTQTGVTWSVVEETGGSITSEGVYTAPATAGTYHIKATSLFDPARSVTIAVMVTASPNGGLNLGVN